MNRDRAYLQSRDCRRWCVRILGFGTVVAAAGAVGWYATVLSVRNLGLAAVVDAVNHPRSADVDGREWLASKWYVAAAGGVGSYSGSVSPFAAAGTRTVLLVVVRNDCEPCDRTLAAWSAGISRRNASAVVQLVAATANIQPADASRASQYPPGTSVSRLRFRNPEQVRTGLGVRSVPFSVVLLPSGRLRAAVVGTPSDRVVNECLDAASPDTTGRFLMKYFADSVPLLPKRMNAGISPVN
jgi:hypothetical protein